MSIEEIKDRFVIKGHLHLSDVDELIRMVEELQAQVESLRRWMAMNDLDFPPEEEIKGEDS